jgi:hypothetical protein
MQSLTRFHNYNKIYQSVVNNKGNSCDQLNLRKIHFDVLPDDKKESDYLLICRKKREINNGPISNRPGYFNMIRHYKVEYYVTISVFINNSLIFEFEMTECKDPPGVIVNKLKEKDVLWENMLDGVMLDGLMLD